MVVLRARERKQLHLHYIETDFILLRRVELWFRTQASVRGYARNATRTLTDVTPPALHIPHGHRHNGVTRQEYISYDCKARQSTSGEPAGTHRRSDKWITFAVHNQSLQPYTLQRCLTRGDQGQAERS